MSLVLNVTVNHLFFVSVKPHPVIAEESDSELWFTSFFFDSLKFKIKLRKPEIFSSFQAIQHRFYCLFSKIPVFTVVWSVFCPSTISTENWVVRWQKQNNLIAHRLELRVFLNALSANIFWLSFSDNEFRRTLKNVSLAFMKIYDAVCAWWRWRGGKLVLAIGIYQRVCYRKLSFSRYRNVSSSISLHRASQWRSERVSRRRSCSFRRCYWRKWWSGKRWKWVEGLELKWRGFGFV